MWLKKDKIIDIKVRDNISIGMRLFEWKQKQNDKTLHPK